MAKNIKFEFEATYHSGTWLSMPIDNLPDPAVLWHVPDGFAMTLKSKPSHDIVSTTVFFNLRGTVYMIEENQGELN